MAFEFLGMSGMTLYIAIISAVLLINWRSKKNFLKFIPVSKQFLGVAGIIGVIWVGSVTSWWGYGETQAAVVTPDDQDVTAGVLLEAEGSESDANLGYDYDTRTFTCQFYENVAGGSTIINKPDDVDGSATISSVTLTITVFRVDTSSIDNATAKVWATVPTFYGVSENSNIKYAPVDKDATSQKYEVAITPAGVAGRDEYNYFTIGRSASKAIVIVTDLSGLGLQQLDNMDSKDVQIYISGADTFTLRFTKIGETSTA